MIIVPDVRLRTSFNVDSIAMQLYHWAEAMDLNKERTKISCQISRVLSASLIKELKGAEPSKKKQEETPTVDVEIDKFLDTTVRDEAPPEVEKANETENVEATLALLRQGL